MRYLIPLLTVLFVGLKLTGTGAVAQWSWIWVLSPLWLGAILGLAVALLAVLLHAWVPTGR